MIGLGDLVAVAAFDGRAHANQAVTRERLGEPPEPARALLAALAHSTRRRRVWLEVEGRRLRGIATARPLSGPGAWEIDTLADAGEAAADAVRSLLSRARSDARRDGATHLLVRLRADASAFADALRAGFERARAEQLWRAASPPAPPVVAASITVNEATDADEHDLFMLHNRALPVAARAAVAMTQAEWRATREPHGAGRGTASLVARAGDRVVGSARVAASRGRTHIELLTMPDAAGAASALLAAAAPRCTRGRLVLVLASASGGAAGGELRAAGFEPAGEYVVLGHRIARPVSEAVTVGAGVAAAGG